MNHASLFSGIGGFDLAAQWMGWNNVLSCEIDPFCNKVLAYHFPESIHYEDIKTTDFTIHRGQIDILTGGFPCQPFSLAGKRRGSDDDRHLWPEMLRAIREIQPRWIVGENVFGLTNWNGGVVFRDMLSDLENEGYEVQPFIIPACAVNAPHRRDRVWIVAHNSDTGIKDLRERKDTIFKPDIFTNHGFIGQEEQQIDPIRIEQLCQNGPAADTDSQGYELRGFEQDRSKKGETESKTHKWERVWNDSRRISEPGDVTDTKPTGLQGQNGTRKSVRFNQGGNEDRTSWRNFPTQPPLRGRNDGFPGGLDGITVSRLRNESIKCYGNAIVPQVAYQIFKAIAKSDNQA